MKQFDQKIVLKYTCGDSTKVKFEFDVTNLSDTIVNFENFLKAIGFSACFNNSFLELVDLPDNDESAPELLQESDINKDLWKNL